MTTKTAFVMFLDLNTLTVGIYQLEDCNVLTDSNKANSSIKVDQTPAMVSICSISTIFSRGLPLDLPASHSC